MAARSFSLRPAITLLALVAIAHLPLGAPANASFVFPAIISALIFIWSMSEPGNVKPWMIFTLGLIADVISSGPIGFWALYYLGVQAMAFWFGRNPTNSGLVLNWIGYLVAALVVTFLSWIVTTIYTMQNADPLPMLIGPALICIVFPVIYWLSGASRHASSSSSSSSLIDDIA